MLNRPKSSEYNPYLERYIGLVPDDDLLKTLKRQQTEMNDFLKSIPIEKGEYRYEKGKWSLKEVVGHIADIERVMSYYLLVVARGDTTTYPSFDKDSYVSNAEYDRLELSDIITELSVVRQSTISLITCLSDNALMRTGTVMSQPTTARALGYVIAGHELHHREIIKRSYL
ncbi:DinB family protein [Pseudalkalibacillus decolorationis]|uniref:DinB family protein n=1 Tax=Pseudalkalibacillus decolorationis TaxID=163879 RepID=UPI002147B586|nr:DinB family protein [Pseudalkalibacillus decolorationis]